MRELDTGNPNLDREINLLEAGLRECNGTLPRRLRNVPEHPDPSLLLWCQDISNAVRHCSAEHRDRYTFLNHHFGKNAGLRSSLRNGDGVDTQKALLMIDEDALHPTRSTLRALFRNCGSVEDREALLAHPRVLELQQDTTTLQAMLAVGDLNVEQMIALLSEDRFAALHLSYEQIADLIAFRTIGNRPNLEEIRWLAAEVPRPIGIAVLGTRIKNRGVRNQNIAERMGSCTNTGEFLECMRIPTAANYRPDVHLTRQMLKSANSIAQAVEVLELPQLSQLHFRGKAWESILEGLLNKSSTTAEGLQLIEHHQFSETKVNHRMILFLLDERATGFTEAMRVLHSPKFQSVSLHRWVLGRMFKKFVTRRKGAVQILQSPPLQDTPCDAVTFMQIVKLEETDPTWMLDHERFADTELDANAVDKMFYRVDNLENGFSILEHALVQRASIQFGPASVSILARHASNEEQVIQILDHPQLQYGPLDRKQIMKLSKIPATIAGVQRVLAHARCSGISLDTGMMNAVIDNRSDLSGAIEWIDSSNCSSVPLDHDSLSNTFKTCSTVDEGLHIYASHARLQHVVPTDDARNVLVTKCASHTDALAICRSNLLGQIPFDDKALTHFIRAMPDIGIALCELEQLLPLVDLTPNVIHFNILIEQCKNLNELEIVLWDRLLEHVQPDAVSIMNALRLCWSTYDVSHVLRHPRFKHVEPDEDLNTFASRFVLEYFGPYPTGVADGVG